ncbi:MAG: hypothetical protein U1F66_07445 [bacterium]
MLRDQIKKNTLAFVSLLIAMTSLLYATWRNENTEYNRNIRSACFEILKSLGELQTCVHYAYYEKDAKMGDPITGWGRVLLVKDLSMVLPKPGPEAAAKLLQTWQENFQGIVSEQKSVDAVIAQINQMREAVLDILHSLH